jgi:UDP-N-acetylglucosamine 4-epimerase
MMNESAYHTADLSQYKFLVTGGAGFIGSNLVAYLLHHHAGQVVVLDDLSTGTLNNLKAFKNNPALQIIEGDIRDTQTCQTAMQGIDHVLHQAALGSVPRSIADARTTNDVNITGFLNILIAARDAGVKRVVYAASSSVYGDSVQQPKTEGNIGAALSPYAVTKYVNELYAGVFAKNYDMQILGLRYFNVFGPGQDPLSSYAAVIPLFMKAAIYGQAPTINGNGFTSRDFTFIDNVVQANILALFAGVPGHDVFNIACGSQTTLNQLWQFICQLAGTEIDAIHGTERRGDVKQSLASIDKAKAVLNYMPQVFVKEGLQRTYQWYENEFAEKRLHNL